MPAPPQSITPGPYLPCPHTVHADGLQPLSRYEYLPQPVKGLYRRPQRADGPVASQHPGPVRLHLAVNTVGSKDPDSGAVEYLAPGQYPQLTAYRHPAPGQTAGTALTRVRPAHCDPGPVKHDTRPA